MVEKAKTESSKIKQQPTKVLAKAGQKEDQSSVNRYCALTGLDVILLIILLLNSTF